MAAGITGAAGAVSLAAAPINGKLRKWHFAYEATFADTTGAGDTVEEQTVLRKKWTLTGEFVALDASSWDLGFSLVGTVIAIAAKRKSGDTNPFISATGLITKVEVDVPYDGAVIVNFEAQNNGTDVTFDTTPAT